MAGPHGIGPKVQELLRQGYTNRRIRRELGVGSATVTYHAKKLGISTARRPTYMWTAVQAAIDNGATFRDLHPIFGLSSTTFYHAVRTGKVTRPGRLSGRLQTYLTPEQLSERLAGKSGRGPRWRMKQKLLETGRLKYECALCKLSKWLGEVLPLRLDHIDGDGTNFSLSNLRLLCGNCDSIQATYCHRNIKKPVTQARAADANRQTSSI
jgi:hypothetical protein